MKSIPVTRRTVLSRLALAVPLGAGLLEDSTTWAAPRSLEFKGVRLALLEAIRNRAFPGCTVSVGDSNGALWEEGLGSLDYTGGPTPTPSTRYDLASLTKVVGTTTVMALATARGQIHPGQLVRSWIPGWDDPDKASVTLAHLLTHTSGLPSWRPLHSRAHGYAEVVAMASQTPLEKLPGHHYSYSDLGMILMGHILERALGAPLAELEKEMVLKPWGMTATTRRVPEGERPACAPVEDGYTQGVVHDENAQAGEGLTGHAGLFSTASDMGRWSRQWLKAWKTGLKELPTPLARMFMSRQGPFPATHRGYGWSQASGTNSAGTLLSSDAYGHTGFTGTSVWIDPNRDLYLVLLTNRVHPTRKAGGISAARVAFADAVAREWDAAKP